MFGVNFHCFLSLKIIRDYVDRVMSKLAERLGVEVPEYDPTLDPVVAVREGGGGLVKDWTQVRGMGKKKDQGLRNLPPY